MSQFNRSQTDLSRRAFLGPMSYGIGALALSQLLGATSSYGGEAAAAPGTGKIDVPKWDGVVKPLHHPAKVKRIIYLFMSGGPSHLEMFDNKPKLAELHGQPMPEEYTKGQPIAQLQGAKLTCFAPQHKFQKFGQSGNEMTEIFPLMGSIADDICIIRSMKTEAINHDPAQTLMNSGTSVPGRPSMGSWVTYGLGSESENLPGFVVLTSLGGFGQGQPIAARQWHSGFLPSRFQGVEFHSKGDAVLYVGNPAGVDATRQRDVVSDVQALDQLQQAAVGDPEIATRIAQYEMAFRMQASIPGLIDIKDETAETLALYGAKAGDGTFGTNCLLARRMAERGVRFIQLYHRGWDHHGGLKDSITKTANEIDRGVMALMTDLKRRDMLKDTLVIFGGEFGRTPMAQGNGRDHHIKGFSYWLAGGGIKPGITYGATDELGYNSVENVVHVHDLHATILHLLGIDHKRLTVRFQGRDLRLTDVHGNVVKAVLS